MLVWVWKLIVDICALWLDSQQYWGFDLFFFQICTNQINWYECCCCYSCWCSFLWSGNFWVLHQVSCFHCFHESCQCLCLLACEEIQGDVAGFERWCDVNFMKVNLVKCFSIQFSRQINLNTNIYFLWNEAIKTVQSVRDFEVIINCKLMFVKHLNLCFNKALKMHHDIEIFILFFC